MLSHFKFIAPLVVAAALLAGCGGPDAAKTTSSAAPASLTVSVESSRSGPMTTSIGATGNVTARQMVLVSTEVTGLAIQQVAVAEGDLVKKGQVLAVLGTDRLQAQIDQQTAANRGSKASLDVAQLAYDRGQQLSANGNLSASDLQSRQSARDTAKSALEQGEAALKSLQLQVAEAIISAPVDGRLAAASPTLGQVVQAGTTLFSIIQNDELEVQTKVPEQLLGKITQGQKAVVANADGVRISGSVRAVAQQVDATTRLGIVYVTLPAESGFRVGMSGEVAFETAVPDVLTVPEAALAWRDGAAGVFTVDDAAKVHFAKIDAGEHQNGRVVVVAGLAAGQKIAVDGVGFLNDGMQVRVADATQTEAQK